MNNDQTAKTLFVDINAFNRHNDTPETVLQNQRVVKFVLDALHDGFDIKIIYDDLDIRAQRKHNQSAKARAEDALEQAMTAYKQHPDLADIVLTYFDGFLTPYSEYQTECDDSESNVYTYLNPPLRADVAIILSPEEEYSKADKDYYHPFIDDYDAYIRPAEIASFNEYKERSKTFQFEAGAKTQRRKTFAQIAQRQTQILIDQAIFANDPDGRIKAANKQVEEDEVLQDFFHGQPLEIITPGNGPRASKAQFFLSRYFANCVRLRNKDDLSMDREYELEAEQTQLVAEIEKMKHGHEAIEIMNSIIIKELYSSPSAP